MEAPFSLVVHERVMPLRRGGPRFNLAERKTLLDNLTFLYQVMRASEDLLEEAHARLLRRPKLTAFERELLDYYRVHLVEETDHATWLAEDLATAKIDVNKLPVSMDAAHIVGAQFYLLRYQHPVALLGYMAYLESAPVQRDTMARLEQIHGRELLRTIRHHAEHDPGHIEDIYALLDRVPEEWRKLVLDNAESAAVWFGQAVQHFGKGH